MHNMEYFEQFLNKPVILTRVSGSRYHGVLNGIRKDKIHLTELTITDKLDNYKASPKHENKRWFSIDKTLKVEEVKNEFM